MRTKKRKKDDIEIPTSSMSDIVFLLLIFFLVTTSMNPDKGLGMTLPPEGEQVKLDKKDILSIHINAEGKILIREDAVELDQVIPKVKDEMARNKKLVISLVTSPDAKYVKMIEVLDQLKIAEATRISLATPHF